jgi:hypothetical protein
MDELKPCPFCGNVPEWDGYEPKDHEFVCKTCDLWGITSEWWNRRIPNPLLPLVRELRKALLDVYSSIPGTYDESDPMVRCHAKALNAIPTILARADKALTGEPGEASRG